MNKKLYVIDGNSLLFRAYYATAYGDTSSIMRTKDGIPTNAIFAFANMLAKILSSFKGGESLFVGFDADGDTFRKQEFAAYKANRKPCPEELIRQLPISRELLSSLGITYFEKHGVEADDICGTLSKMAAKDGYDVVIYTSDKDYLQLIEPTIEVSLLKTGLSNMDVVTNGNMKEKFGFSPSQIIDFKGLRGDASDNLPGIPGVGDKTAIKLLNEYGTFEAIIAAGDEIKGKLGENIRNNADLGRQCYRLATIKTDVELPFSLASLQYQGYDLSLISAFAAKYEFKNILARLPLSLAKGGETQKAPKTKEVTLLPSLKGDIGLCLDADFSSYHETPCYGLAIFDGNNLYYQSIENLLKDEAAIKMLEDSTIAKHLYDSKATTYLLKSLNINLQGVKNDVLIAAYLLDSSGASTPEDVFSSFGYNIIEESEDDVALFSLGDKRKASLAAYASYLLKEKITQSLSSVEALTLYQEVELPLSLVLADMELAGFPLDETLLTKIGETFKEKRDASEKKIFLLASHSFNVNSPKQVATVLFDELKIGNGKEKSTGVEVLDRLKEESPIVEEILEYRKYAKLIGTYIDGLLPYIKEDGKLHTYFNQALTSTGRLSSSSPNLQNVSTRDEEGKLVRKAFIPKNDNDAFLSLDYGQIELRILASLANCKAYLDVFETNRDVHSETAKKIFATEDITPLMRRKAKAVNFAIIYGSTIYGLSEQIEGTPKEAADMIDAFYNHYPEVRSYLDNVSHDALSKGYVTTMLGRRRYLKDLNDPNYAKREASRRAALNAPVQGSAADLIKIAMNKCASFLKEGGYATKMVLMVHDELIFQGPKEELEMLKDKLANIMENAYPLSVRLTVEGSIGHCWYDAKE